MILILGDSGYFLKNYLLTPVLNPNTYGEACYNAAHIATRNVIERFFGVWKRRFPVLAYGCRLKLETVLSLIVAVGVVHNICKANYEDDPPNPEDLERFLEYMNENEIPNVPPPPDNIVNGVRINLIEHYFSDM